MWWQQSRHGCSLGRVTALVNNEDFFDSVRDGAGLNWLVCVPALVQAEDFGWLPDRVSEKRRLGWLCGSISRVSRFC